jgi:hypothetical protein
MTTFSNIINTYATNSIVMSTVKKEEKISTIKVSNRLKYSLNEMVTKGESYEDIIWRLIQYWDVAHGDHLPIPR